MALSGLSLRHPLLHPNVSLLRIPKPLPTLFKGPPPLSYSSATTNSHGGAPKEYSDDEKQIAVPQQSSSNSPSRRRNHKRGLLSWKNPLNNLPFNLGGGLGHALVAASDTLSYLLENLNANRWLGEAKQDDKCYKMRYEVPGLSREDLKIIVDGRYLIINGEHKEEEGGGDGGWYGGGDGGWYAREFHNANLMLPYDADVKGIKAEVKDGILTLTIPMSEVKKRNVKEVQIE